MPVVVAPQLLPYVSLCLLLCSLVKKTNVDATHRGSASCTQPCPFPTLLALGACHSVPACPFVASISVLVPCASLVHVCTVRISTSHAAQAA